MNPRRFPFLFLPRLHREIFIKSVRTRKISSQRDILNCYMTSYFDAWLDYRGIYENKKYVAGFVP